MSMVTVFLGLMVLAIVLLVCAYLCGRAALSALVAADREFMADMAFEARCVDEDRHAKNSLNVEERDAT